MCLNPCFNGRYSQRTIFQLQVTSAKSLNPCFNGRYSQRGIKLQEKLSGLVLILVLMEDTLRVRMPEINYKPFSLNPCFNGRYSQRTCRQVP